MNKVLRLQVRNAACDLCQMAQGAETVCVTGSGPEDADIIVVGKQPWYDKIQGEMSGYLEDVGIDPDAVLWTSATKCKNWVLDPTRTDVKVCAQYIGREIEVVKPRWILALGNEALQALTGRSGISKYRAQVFPRQIHGVDVNIIPSLSPSAVSRNPGQRAGFMADLRFFASQVKGERVDEKPDYTVVRDKELLKAFADALRGAETNSYDIETYGRSEHDEDALLISVSCTLATRDGELSNWALPLGHPSSPWRGQWRKVLKALDPAWNAARKHVAHNGKFDARWLRHFGLSSARVTFDTMLAAHLLNENEQKGLKILARSRLGVEPWGIDTKDLRRVPLAEVLEYNVLDSFYMYRLYQLIREDLVAQPRLARLFKFLMMPANEVYIRAESRGVWVDRERLANRHKQAEENRAEIDRRLMEFVPDEIPVDDLPKAKRGRSVINFGPSNFLRWLLFGHLGLTVIKRGAKSGLPACSEEVLLELKDEHPIVEILLERAWWQKCVTSFTGAYMEILDDNDRIHTSFKLFGTVTGRTSSGKEEADKVNVQRGDKLRGVNLQQVPRDPFVRGLFGAEPGWTFVEADFSQVELRVVAFLSRDPTMLTLYLTGQDIHTATASWVLGKPASQVTKVDRKKAKAVNFGFVYGMGARKFIQTAFLKYGLTFTLEEAQAIRTAFFEQFKSLPRWHAKQRRLAHRHKRVVSPLGRVRHLPDIDSPDEGVKAEAERQAINSPVQSFASDLTLLSMILLDQQFTTLGLPARVIGTVHDAINFEVRDDAMAEVLPLIKDIMENLPIKRLFGCEVDVPILADLKVGSHWGDAREVMEEEIYAWPVPEIPEVSTGEENSRGKSA